MPSSPGSDADGADGNLLHAKALPPFAALRAFEAFGRTGSVRQAARSLGVHHAVVSRHLRSLEDWLSVPLVERTTGSVTLTEIGVDYHRRISTALVELASATATLTRAGDLDNIKLWCVPGFAAQWLSHRLAEFERLHPDCPVELRPTETGADLLAHQADIDIRYFGDQWPPEPGGPGLRCAELARPEMIAVASPDFVARLGRIESAADLLEATLLHEEHDEQWRAWFSAHGVEAEGPLRGTLFWHAHLAVAAARQGRGIALGNHYLVEQELRDGSLQRLDVGGRPAVIGAYMFVAREDRWTTPAIVRLRKFLQKEAARG